MKDAWLDVSVFRCPFCGRYYADASWYVVTLESDIECNICHQTFNAKKHLTDRLMLRLQIDEDGRVRDIKLVEHLPEE